jgi:predicted amidophosphoribosyltransferase
MKCPHCGNEAQDDAIFCDQCGTRLKPAAAPAAAPQPAASTAAGVVCPSCGHVNTPGEMFCSECGARLAAPQPEPATVTQAAATAAPVTPSAEGRTCPACGASVAQDEDFCYACGADLRAPAAATPVAAPQSQPAPAPIAAPPEPAAQGVSAAENECPACGAKVKPGDAFCEFCGAALVKEAPAVQPAPAAPAPAAAPTAPAAPQPRLVVVASGVEIPLPAGQEVLVGREDPYSNVFPDVDLTPHGGEEGGVSRRHFKISLVGGQYLVEDLNSTNFTLLNRQRLQPGTPAKLADGDEIRAGRVRLIFRVS